MSKTIDSATKAASALAVVRPVTLVELDFSSGFTRMTDAPFSITADANADGTDETYIPDFGLGSIGPTVEGTEVKPYHIDLQLSGVLGATLSLALGEDYQGRPGRVCVALLDGNDKIIGAPITIFKGKMDVMDIEFGPEAVITVTLENDLADWERRRLIRYTNEDQQSKYPGDKGLEFLSQLVDKQLIWGRA